MIWQGHGELRADGAIGPLPGTVHALRGGSLRRKKSEGKFPIQRRRDARKEIIHHA